MFVGGATSIITFLVKEEFSCNGGSRSIISEYRKLKDFRSDAFNNISDT